MSDEENTFTLTETHLKLLQGVYVEYQDGPEHGTVGTDYKRPFGNGDRTGDMARICGFNKIEVDGGEEYWPEGTTEKMLYVFRVELPIAMQIVLHNPSGVETGVYVRERYGKKWQQLEVL